MINWFDLVILGLATWRISYMLVWENGPWDIFERYRHALEPEHFGDKLFSCVWCLSVWIGAIFVLSAIIDKTITVYVASVFALSAVAIIITEYLDGKS